MGGSPEWTTRTKDKQEERRGCGWTEELALSRRAEEQSTQDAKMVDGEIIAGWKKCVREKGVVV